MKKTSKSTGAGKTPAARSQRRTASGGKPVTIDLKAEEVADIAARPKVGPGRTTPLKPKTGATASTLADAEKPDTSAKTAASPKNAEKRSEVAQPDVGSNAKKESMSNGPTPGDDKPTSQLGRPSARSARRSGDQVNRFASALLGGCIALIGAGALQYSGFIGNSVDDPTHITRDIYEAQTGALQSEVEALKAGLQSLQPETERVLDLEKIDARINARIEQLGNVADQPDIDALIEQVNQTTVRVEKLLAGQAASASSVESLEVAIRSGGAGENAAMAAIAGQVKDLSSRLDGAIGSVDHLKEEMAKLAGEQPSVSNADISTLANRVSMVEGAAGNMQDLAAQITALRQAVLTGEQALKRQQEEMNHLQAGLEQSKSPRRLVGQAIAAAALKSDIDRGVPFATSLTMLQNFSPANASLKKLHSFAEGGIPTAAQLLMEFDAIGSAIIVASEPDPTDDLGSRLLAGVKSYVTVKIREPVGGTTPAAIVSQMMQALRSGNLQPASDLWSTLSSPGQDVSRTWHQKLQSRIIADELISNSVQSFLNSAASQ
jgi:hypothetical protein